MSPPGRATHAISTAILDQNYGIKPKEYSLAPGNEARLAQFLTQKEIDAAIIRSVTIAQMEETKLRRLASIVDEWKSSLRAALRRFLSVTIVYNDYLGKNSEAVAKFIVAIRKTVEYGSKNKSRVVEVLQKVAHMDSKDATAYASQWDGAYMASFEPQDITSLKRRQEIVKAHGARKKDPLRAPLIQSHLCVPSNLSN